MALDTDTKKLSMMDWCQVWESGLPLSPGTIGQDDQQHLLWGQSDTLWPAGDGAGTRRQRQIKSLIRRRRR